MNRPRRQSGFTLIEVLVSLLILAVGLLGLAGLQAHSLRNNFNAYLRTQATFAVDEIMDRMRANRTYAVTSQGYDLAYGGSVSGVDCSSVRCTPAQLSNADRAQWLVMVDRLPNGEGSIDVAATGVATVRVRWNDRRDGNPDNLLEFVGRSQL